MPLPPYATSPRDDNGHHFPYTQSFFCRSRSRPHRNHGLTSPQGQRQTEQRQTSVRPLAHDERPLRRRWGRRFGAGLRAWHPGHRRGQAVQVRSPWPSMYARLANSGATAAKTSPRTSTSKRLSPPASITTSYPSSVHSPRANPRCSITSSALSSASCPSRSAVRPPKAYG
jgi:hypothetical protein